MIPEAYKTGFQRFYGRDFFVNRDVLIPRIETEEIIDLVKKYRPKKIADVGAGSGCIGITLALELKCEVTLIDISPKAMAVARINAKRLGAKVKIKKHDLLDGGKYDLVVANLPYIPRRRHRHLPPEVRDYEPRLALDGGRRGLEIIYRLLENCRAKTIILEIDDTHKKSDFERFGEVEILKDRFGKTRFALFARKYPRRKAANA
jgi:release factor glutamine methyltransferase